MGTETFVELLWRIHTKPGIVVTSSGKDRYEPSLEDEATQPAVSVYLFSWPSPDVTILGGSTFLNAI